MQEHVASSVLGQAALAARMPAPVVVLAQGRDPAGHRLLTTTALAGRIARLRGSLDLGLHESPGGGRYYAVPTGTLIGEEEAARFGIESEADLFGGYVRHAVHASKTITHALVSPEASAPAGWVPGFASAVESVVLRGASAFDARSALDAGLRLLENGRVRLKPGWADGGQDQHVVADAVGLEVAFSRFDEASLAACGLVLEEDLVESAVYSVGQVQIGSSVLSYYGQQCTTKDNEGRTAYGGSTLTCVPGELDQLLDVCPDESTREAVRCALVYDRAALTHFPGMIASRRNYDVICGHDAFGRLRIGVLEQSWRLGGATGAEIAAFEAFAEDPELAGVRACCVEVYGAVPEPPKDGFIYFSGDDPAVGPLTKYARIEARHRAL